MQADVLAFPLSDIANILLFVLHNFAGQFASLYFYWACYQRVSFEPLPKIYPPRVSCICLYKADSAWFEISAWSRCSTQVSTLATIVIDASIAMLYFCDTVFMKQFDILQCISIFNALLFMMNIYNISFNLLVFLINAC